MREMIVGFSPSVSPESSIKAARNDKEKQKQTPMMIRASHIAHHLQFLALSALRFAPTAKNSVMTSRGIPLVSGTLKYTKNHAMVQTTA